MDALAPFRIPAAALKADEATYEWNLGSDFLSLFDAGHEGINGDFKVTMELLREGGMTTLEFLIQGVVPTTCDRCMAPIQLHINAEYPMVVKIGDPAQSNDEVIFVDADAPDLNVANHIYDFILVSVPISHRIPDCEQLDPSPCDRSVLDYLIKNQNEIQPLGDLSSPWDQLKNVTDN